MNTPEFKDAYASVLKAFVESPEEQYLAKAADLGQKTVRAGIPPEDIAEIHEEAVWRLAEQFPDKTLLESVQRISAPLMEMLVAYGLAFREREDERRRAEQALEEYSEGLEEMVEQRTAELKAANKELESFAYSVSHDLRAPLRAINGFSKALLEDCGDGLSARGKDYLNRVMAGTQRMDQLIDDLLQLSRLTRAEMRYGSVDLSAMAGEIADELRQGEPDRHVEFTIAPGLTGWGDHTLLRDVLNNLLANAWKFTSGHDRARIEFGVVQSAGETAYFVRDDGAGFDMTYADKLFGAFQRLHKVDEFPGTGIGLATAQRIIHRHGGRIWAEGAVNKGATFYFTLGQKGGFHG